MVHWKLGSMQIVYPIYLQIDLNVKEIYPVLAVNVKILSVVSPNWRKVSYETNGEQSKLPNPEIMWDYMPS